MNRRSTRAPLLLVALASMTWGVWMGLLRIGWALPLPWPDQLILHGPLMIGGFLGTLIALERAIGVARPWAYLAPLLTACGSVLLVAASPGWLGPALITAGSIVVILIFAVVVRRQPALFAWTISAGAVAWVAGNVHWLSGAGIYRVTWWWIGFVVLTIAGERLELNRLLQPRPGVRVGFATSICVISAGVVLSTQTPGGIRVMGAGMLMLTAWLARFDLARRTVRMSGVTRFSAVCLLCGYGWLAVGGIVAITAAPAEPGAHHDALLHAIFLGFAVSMVFGHAPIIFPAVLGTPLPFREFWYGHVAVLQASVVARIVGDLVPELARLRVWGGLLNAAALALFVCGTVASIVLHRPNASVADPRPRGSR